MNIFTTIFIITFASLGFRAITGKGMILYFLRSPFDRLAEIKKEIDELMLTALDEKGAEAIPTRSIIVAYSIRFILYIMKPVLLCSTCMASVHTLVWFKLFNLSYDAEMIAVMLSVAFLNTLLWSCVELVQKTTSSIK